MLLSFSESLATKYIYLKNEVCLAKPAFIDLNPNELHYYAFMVSLNNGSCNTLDDLSGRSCAPNKMEDVNLNVFSMIAINELKTLTKHILCGCKDGRKCNSNQKWKNNKCQCEYKKPIITNTCKNDYVWTPSTRDCEINYADMKSLIHDSVIICDKIIDAVDKLYNVTLETETKI